MRIELVRNVRLMIVLVTIQSVNIYSLVTMIRFPMRSCQYGLSICLCACLGLAGLLLPMPRSSGAIAQTMPSVSSDAALEQSEQADAAALFSLNCAGCHAHGGNIVRRGKNLKQKTLVRNGYGEIAAIAALIAQGKGAMPAYADRLTAEEMAAIAQYVHQQAELGWRN